MPATVDAAFYLNQSSVGSKPRASASSNPFKNQSKAAGGRPLRRHQSDKKDSPPRSPEADADWRGDVAPDVGAGPTLKAQLNADAKDQQALELREPSMRQHLLALGKCDWKVPKANSWSSKIELSKYSEGAHLFSTDIFIRKSDSYTKHIKCF